MSARKAWAEMIARCYDPSHPKYQDYGSAGIRVCERWICFRLFLQDMGERPVGMTLSRKDKTKNYSANNCVWMTCQKASSVKIRKRREVVDLSRHLLEEIFRYEDGKLYWKKQRSNVKAGQEAGSINRRGYVQVSLFNKQYLAHRLIFLMHHGYLPAEIDHIDSNPSNNKIENLREATHEQNIANVGIRRTNSSGYKNVSFDAKKKKWIVAMRVNKTTYHGGSFSNVEDANKKAIQMRNELSKEFANHGRLV